MKNRLIIPFVVLIISVFGIGFEVSKAQSRKEAVKDPCPLCGKDETLAMLSQSVSARWEKHWGPSYRGKDGTIQNLGLGQDNILLQKRMDVNCFSQLIGRYGGSGPVAHLCVNCGNIYCKMSEVRRWQSAIAEMHVAIERFEGPIDCSDCSGTGEQILPGDAVTTTCRACRGKGRFFKEE